MLKYEQCPAPWNMTGDYMTRGIEEYCAVCNEKRECEIDRLTKNIAIMDILQDRSDSTIQPLFGWDNHDELHNKKLTRIAELMEAEG